MDELRDVHWIWGVWISLLVGFVFMAWWIPNRGPGRRDKPKR
jgi:hypothetical protein